MKKKLITFILLIIAVVSLTSCGKKELKRYEKQIPEIFDTFTSVVGFSESESKFNSEIKKIENKMYEYHKLYDIYNNYKGINNIRTINDNAGVAPIKVDKKIIDLLLFSKEAYEKTNGKTNIAMGAVLKIWHEHRTQGINNPEKATIPKIEELKEAYKYTNFDDVIIDEKNSTVFLKDPNMSIDVGAIAKGYATEKISQYAKEIGFNSILFSVGGNVRAVNNNIITKKPWNIGLQNPDKTSDKKVLDVLKLEDMSMVTSGAYERFYTVDGTKYNHIIDSQTLFPADYFLSVSIITKDSGMADVLSTAVFCMPYEDGLKLIESLDNTEALWIFKDGTMKYSDNFKSYIKE